MKYIVAFFCFALISCNQNTNSSIEGEYFGFWAETIWTIKIQESNNFEISSDGHFGITRTSGKYLLENDTLILNLNDTAAISKYTDHEKFLVSNDNCLIDIESRYDYCKTASNERSSAKRDIYYPQTSIDSERNKPLVTDMIQKAINSIESETKLDSTIVLNEYYEINKQNDFKFNRFGRDIVLESKNELEKQGITNYILIEHFDFGQKSALVQLRIEPYFESFNSTIVTFKKENSEWVIENNGR